MDKEVVVCISGGFDPVHGGHIDLFREAKVEAARDLYRKGSKVEDLDIKLIVLLNSDDWLTRKKGKPFMCWEERAKVISSLKWVWGVTSVYDVDGTVCAGLEQVHPHYFANGGDRLPDNTPELDLCKRLNITPLFNVGGGKVQSSSELLKKYADAT